ncbi:MAG: DUF45 domain-containing protein [Bacilli bacterium]|nr:DUF45 domain-containing protein [Bacilli bacterium]
MKFELDGVIYPIIIDRKFNQKNTYIRVKKDLAIHVTTGLLTTNKFIINLIDDNYSKIVNMINIQLKKKDNNDGFFFLGKKYNVIYINQNKMYIEDDNVYIGKDYDIYNFYKKEAKKIFLERIEYLYSIYSRSIPHPNLKIRRMTTRWGVCNIKSHTVTLNLELIKRDIKYLDYVIIHELTHLVYADHSKSFWSVVEENMPDYKKYRKEMKEFL